MHILFITNEYPKPNFSHGGVGTFVQTLGKSLIANGHKVSVVGINYTDNNEDEEDNGVLIYRLRKKRIKGLTWLLNSSSINKKIKELHKKEKIDIIETAELGLSFLNKIKGIKYIIRLHGGHHFFAEAENRGINKWKGFQEKKSFSKADAFIAVSNYVKMHTAKYLTFNNKPVAVISCPVEFSKFYTADKSKIIKNSIVFVGTVCEKKGVRQLIHSLPFVIEKYPDAHLHIYGRDWLFPNKTSYISYLKEQIPENIKDKITFYGSVAHNQLPEIYEKAAVCVFPSHMETQGLVAPEAMSMEKVVVFTELGPGPETIEPYVTGLLCNPLDSHDIASKIMWVFENDAKTIEIGSRARISAIEKFSPETQLNANVDFYRRIL